VIPALAALLLPSLTVAQAPHAGTVEIGAGVVWTAGYDAGGRPATETRPSGAPLTLFQTDSRLRAALGLDARLGVYVTPRLSVEGVFRASRPALRTHLSGDFESVAAVDAEETIGSYLAGGSVVYHVARRFAPFVSAGAGYLRQVHEDNAGVLSGVEVHAGGGILHALTHGRHPVALRIEGQISTRSRSVAFEQKRRTVPSLAFGITWRR